MTPAPTAEIVPFIVADAGSWRDWLDRHEESADGVWLVLAKKGVATPTSLTYAEALDEALCSGWIDGQKRSRDATTFLQRFTPRRPRSIWSERNVGHTARLIEEGRMRDRGFAEIAKAQADGRWERAYKGSASIEVPAELITALAASPDAARQFDALSGQNRYAVLHRVTIGRTAEARQRAAERIVERLAHGETPHPQNPPEEAGS